MDCLCDRLGPRVRPADASCPEARNNGARQQQLAEPGIRPTGGSHVGWLPHESDLKKDS